MRTEGGARGAAGGGARLMTTTLLSGPLARCAIVCSGESRRPATLSMGVLALNSSTPSTSHASADGLFLPDVQQCSSLPPAPPCRSSSLVHTGGGTALGTEGSGGASFAPAGSSAPASRSGTEAGAACATSLFATPTGSYTPTRARLRK
eukprot:2723912-Prymnesium_polylepis.2